MKTFHLAWLGISLTVAAGMTACEGDSAKAVRDATDGGQAGQAGDSGVNTGGSMMTPGGAGASAGGAAGAGPGSAGAAGAAPTAGAPGTAGAGGQGPLGGGQHRGTIDISIIGTPEATSLNVSAEVLAIATTAAQRAAAEALVADSDARRLVGKADGCYPDIAPLEPSDDVPPGIDAGAGPTVSANDELLAQADLLGGPYALYAAVEAVGAQDLEAVEVGGFGELALMPDPFEIGVQQAGFSSDQTFNWFTGDDTFPIALTMTAPPVAGTWLVVDLGPYLCKITPPATAQQGFVVEVPANIVAELPKYPLFVSGVTVDAFVSADVPVDGGSIRVTTHFRQLPYYVNGQIDAPQGRTRSEKQRRP